MYDKKAQKKKDAKEKRHKRKKVAKRKKKKRRDDDSFFSRKKAWGQGKDHETGIHNAGLKKFGKKTFEVLHNTIIITHFFIF